MNSKSIPATSDSLPHSAIVLAGGLGTRLRAAIADQPKVLALAAGRPFLSYLLTYLSKQGISQVILATGYKGEQVREYVGDGRRWSLEVIYCQEQSPLGTGGALRLASEALEDKPFFGLNGDTLFQVDLQRLWKAHRKADNFATLALRQVVSSERSRRGCVKLSKDGRILSFDEKPGSIDTHTIQMSLVNGGVYLLEKKALAAVTPGSAASMERDVFPELARRGLIAGLVEDGYFADIGTPQSLAAFEDDLNRGAVPDIAGN